MKPRIAVIVLVVSWFTSACSFNHKIDAEEAFREGRAWSASVSAASVAGVFTETGERLVYTGDNDTCYMSRDKFYGIRGRSDTTVIEKDQVDSIAIRRTINCEEKVLWYNKWAHGFVLDADSSVRALAVDRRLVHTIQLKDNTKIKLAEPGLFMDCSDERWRGISRSGQEVRIETTEIAMLNYDKPDGIVTMISALLISGTALAFFFPIGN